MAPLSVSQASGESPSPMADAEDEGLTLMFRNVPKSYTQDSLLHEVMERLGAPDVFDFFYLPAHFMKEKNRGFAFVNCRDAAKAQHCRDVFNNFQFKRSVENVDKPCEISTARIQGLINNVLSTLERADAETGTTNPRPVIAWKGEYLKFEGFAAMLADQPRDASAVLMALDRQWLLQMGTRKRDAAGARELLPATPKLRGPLGRRPPYQPRELPVWVELIGGISLHERKSQQLAQQRQEVSKRSSTVASTADAYSVGSSGVGSSGVGSSGVGSSAQLSWSHGSFFDIYEPPPSKSFGTLQSLERDLQVPPRDGEGVPVPRFLGTSTGGSNSSTSQAGSADQEGPCRRLPADLAAAMQRGAGGGGVPLRVKLPREVLDLHAITADLWV